MCVGVGVYVCMCSLFDPWYLPTSGFGELSTCALRCAARLLPKEAAPAEPDYVRPKDEPAKATGGGGCC
jgi:hypothetical protein